MARIINLQMPVNNNGTMLFSADEEQHIIYIYKELFPNDEIIVSPLRLVPTDDQLNIELSERLLATSKETYQQYLLMEFCEQYGVDNWDGYGAAKNALNYYNEHGNLDNYKDHY